MIHSEQYTQNQRAALSQLMLVSELMQADMRQGLEERGLTQVRAHLLWELGARQPMTQRELAAVLQVTPRNVTTLLDALEASGHVVRVAHPEDRRAVLVSLSATGNAARARLQAEQGEMAGLLFAGVTPAELEVFSRVLAQAAERLGRVSAAG